MTRMAEILRFGLFCVFFTAGAGAIAIALLAEEIQTYYHNKQTLYELQQAGKKIEVLTEQYTAQIEQIRRDPEILKKLQWAVLGREPNEADTVFPRVSDQELSHYMAVMEASRERPPSITPAWVQRSNQPNFRYGLFFAGTGLVLITFIFFGSGRPVPSVPAGKR